MVIESASIQAISINSGYLRAKRVLDTLFILLFSIPILIVWGIIAVSIKLDTKGPILYRQKRAGQNGVEFEMLKFRSMYVDSDDTPHREAAKLYMNGETLNGDAENPYKMGDDDRVTRVGRIIRKLGIDELTQAWNILRGEMSLVGPRPPTFYEVELYTPHDWLRLSGPPGLTGYWQVHGRSRVTFQEMVEMDIAYLQQQSLWLDLKLIVLTIPVIISGRGGV